MCAFVFYNFHIFLINLELFGVALFLPSAVVTNIYYTELSTCLLHLTESIHASLTGTHIFLLSLVEFSLTLNRENFLHYHVFSSFRYFFKVGLFDRSGQSLNIKDDLDCSILDILIVILNGWYRCIQDRIHCQSTLIGLL